MKKSHRKIIVSLVITLSIMATIADPASAAVPVKVELGTTSTFAVLAGTTITNTGTTTISGDAGGDVGLYPGTAFTGQASVTLSGAVHLADDVASIAKDDLVSAYNDAAGRTPTTAISADLGGGTTLYPGVYNSASSIGITGTLTLDAQGDPEAAFIFQAGSTLTTASNSRIILANGARFCRVFWQVGSSASLGTNSIFVGHILALTSIAANTGAVIQGQLLARNGEVTLDSNTITNGICLTAVVVRPLIKVVKTPDTLELTSRGGSVKYTYKVTNPGEIALSNVSVTDDKVSTVRYVSGDVNSDTLLQPGETWVYTSSATLTETTTNTATATGSANGMTATNITSATVAVVSPTPTTSPAPTTSPVAPTVNGGRLPDTATPWFNILLVGVGLVTLGLVGFIKKRKHE